MKLTVKQLKEMIREQIEGKSDDHGFEPTGQKMFLAMPVIDDEEDIGTSLLFSTRERAEEFIRYAETQQNNPHSDLYADRWDLHEIMVLV